MKVANYLLCTLVLLLFVVLAVRPQENGQLLPTKYRMELVYIFEPGPTEYIFVIGNTGFRSVDSLKEFLGKLPAGSTIEWAPGCRTPLGAPLLSSEQEMEDFKAFCAEKNLNFVLVPSG